MDNSGAITSRGWVFDLLVSIAEDLAACNHLHEYIYAFTSKNRETDDTDMTGYVEARTTLINLISLRRKKMRFLFDSLGGNNKLYCPLKHLLLSYLTISEVWEATEDETILELMDATGDELASIISLSLNLPHSNCLRCLSDYLLSNDHPKSEEMAA